MAAPELGSWRIGVLSSNMGKANISPFQHILQIAHALAEVSAIVDVRIAGTPMTEVATGDSAYVRYVHRASGEALSRLTAFVGTQLRTSLDVLRLSKRVDVWIFYQGEVSILPMLAAFATGRPVIVTVGGSIRLEAAHRRYPYAKLSLLLRSACLLLANRIVTYSELLVPAWNLSPYRPKVRIAREHYADAEHFKITTAYAARNLMVGYIGRLSEEKGILPLLDALPDLLREFPELQFMFVGDGTLKAVVEERVRASQLESRVGIEGWVEHARLGAMLNRLKLLVLPSFSEGLPNIILEAFACGTPVVATSAGAIPALVRTGETGFLIQTVTSEGVKEGIRQALKCDSLDQISRRAEALAGSEFTFNRCVEQWRSVLGDALEGHGATRRKLRPSQAEKASSRAGP